MQFLDYAQLESGERIRVNVCPIDVGQAIRWVVETSDASSLVTVDVEEGVPPVMVDPDRFDQVLFNLLSNALKFSPPGSPVKITASPSGNQVRISVVDHEVPARIERSGHGRDGPGPLHEPGLDGGSGRKHHRRQQAG